MTPSSSARTDGRHRRCWLKLFYRQCRSYTAKTSLLPTNITDVQQARRADRHIFCLISMTNILLVLFHLCWNRYTVTFNQTLYCLLLGCSSSTGTGGHHMGPRLQRAIYSTLSPQSRTVPIIMHCG